MRFEKALIFVAIASIGSPALACDFHGAGGGRYFAFSNHLSGSDDSVLGATAGDEKVVQAIANSPQEGKATGPIATAAPAKPVERPASIQVSALR